MISSSIRLSFAGFDVDWMMNMSSPRTFSNTSTKISWSLKRSTRVLTSSTISPRWIEMRRAIAVASGRLELPAISFGLNRGFMTALSRLHPAPGFPVSIAARPCKAPESGDAGGSVRGTAVAQIDYYLFPLSPFSYLAGLELERIAATRGSEIVYKPVQLFRIFEAVGTAKVADRHPAKQAYRLADIARVAKAAGLPVNLRPAFWPTNAAPASAAIIAAQAAGGGDLGGLAHGFLRAVWAEDRDIAEDAVVREVLAAHGFDPGLGDRGLLAAMETLERNTDEALRRGVFGAPSYVVGGEVFWGQDRLAHLDAHLAEVG